MAFNLRHVSRRVESGFYATSRVAAIIASIALAVMMLLTVADVIGRYFFSKPIRGTWELVGLLLVCAGTWGWAYCQKERMHVRINVLTDVFSKKVQLILRIVAYLLGIVGFSFICWRMGVRALKYFFMPSTGLTATLEIPYYPFMMALMIGAGLMALMLLIDLIQALAEVTKK
jgi:TRAP-type C4-dicarboxylate transport system permease small subunit